MGDNAPAVEGVISGSVEIPDNKVTTPVDETSPQRIFEKLVPEEFQKKEWVQNLQKTDNPVAEFFKQHEHAQSKIGERSTGLQVPAADAGGDAWKSFYEAIGAGKEVTDYTYTPPTFEDEEAKKLGDYINSTRPEKFMDAIKVIAKEAGLRPDQFQKLAGGYDKALIEYNKTQLAEAKLNAEKFDVNFDKLMTDMHGTDREAVVNRGKALLDQTLREKAKPLMHALGPDGLTIMATFAEDFRIKYLKSDNFDNKGGQSSNPTTLQEISNEGRRLMQLPAYNDSMHPDHDKVKKQVSENYARQAQLR